MDRNIFNKLVSHLKEQKLRDIFVGLEKGSIDPKSYELLKNFINEALSLENTFSNQEVNEKLNKLMEKMNSLFDLLSNPSGSSAGYRSYNSSLLVNILNLKEPVIELYRSFYMAGKATLS